MKAKPDRVSQADWDEVDSPPLSQAMLARMQPVSQAHPEIPPRVQAPQQTQSKIPISVRLSPQVVKHFKSLGRGWQVRLDEILCEYVASHK
ncbi:MAG TPA: hypothetical protein EYG15_06895 [Deltaproteobacteria bacterium]|jgi:uncharacterized protein (DUF4415 family)|nr:hypothetical protein [Candidatus Lambdaproteobacteria bacterium]HIL15812.1 hypothetical protein [Deltaproteobacteria bacterium]